jgi:ATP-dependent 26S proteasome regulatory subunit
MLDIRIIASTNAKRIELDEAVTRPGRMCRHTTIGSLPFEQAKEIYTRLTEKEPTFKKRTYTLAEVYRFARQDGWTAEEKAPTYEGGNYA